MANKKIPQYLKKEVEPFSLPSHLCKTLRSLPNKSAFVCELLMENMDRITGGDVELKLKVKELEVERMVVECIRTKKGLFDENIHELKELNEALKLLSESISKSDELKGKMEAISKDMHAISESTKSLANTEKLADEICERIFARSEQISKEYFEF